MNIQATEEVFRLRQKGRSRFREFEIVRVVVFSNIYYEFMNSHALTSNFYVFRDDKDNVSFSKIFV